ncbi:MAG: LysR family transcriptional regulator [Halioglobus sp.]
MRYTLRQLEVFLATAKHQNISIAAEQLAMSQSAASSSLKELEQQFDVQLFDRLGKRLQLSELGRQIRPQAENLLAQALAFEASLGDGDALGQLNIGATLTIGNYLAVEMIAAFKQQFPAVEIGLSVDNTEKIAQRVASFELDMGMIEGELTHPELHIEHWRNDQLQVFAAPDHPLATRRKISDLQLIEQNWIVRESGSGTRQTFERAMQGILPDLTISMELQHTEAIKRAVEAGLGVGCLSRISLLDAFARGSLVPLNVPHRDFSRELYLITHKQKYQNSALKHWLAMCNTSSD